jgi:competence protein ComEC
VIITHPHKDHIGDIVNFDELTPKILNRPKGINKDKILKNIKKEDKPIFDKYFEISDRYSSPTTGTDIVSDPANWGGLKIEHFHPSDTYDNINNCSIVTCLEYANIKVLIPGDNEPESWKELLTQNGFKESIKGVNVLVAPHHGRESGYSLDFCSKISPYLTIVSDSNYVDTSATDKYSKLSSGWEVHHRDGKKDEKRQCVTTRSDGVINIKIGFNEPPASQPFLSVTIN